ncbi:hypothetical protein PanWU01x14_029100 [Parasponia andersonii]|uniref:Uncharacterized protein n=1 Tax=Parasponia andersonii TaxID=3476 RepID=A0A2P5DVI9_PARAD|nr:hypothetical protein PanWU01x14_029100 [Parasponia andersonii]
MSIKTGLGRPDVAKKKCFINHHRNVFHNRGFLKHIGINHPLRDLSCDGDERHVIKDRISEATDQVSSTRVRSGDAHTREARGGGASIPLCRKNPALLVVWEDVANNVRARERLVDLQSCAARVGEDVGDALELEGLDEDVGTLSGLIGVEPRDEGGGF